MAGALDPRISNVLHKINRADFAPKNTATSKNPVPISFNAIVSAPTIHLYAFKKTAPYLGFGDRVLGVSCGSGYLIVCFAELVKPNEKVVGVEHIRKLVKILITNARKSWSHHLRSDGQFGYLGIASYKAVHVGAAVKIVPRALIDQFALGGLSIIPVGSPNEQYMHLITKGATVRISTARDIGVRFVPLTGKEKQYPTT